MHVLVASVETPSDRATIRLEINANSVNILLYNRG